MTECMHLTATIYIRTESKALKYVMIKHFVIQIEYFVAMVDLF